jgi:outer membrane protein assembly factor BamE (lipoprotein component of BamABCDE complex)
MSASAIPSDRAGHVHTELKDDIMRLKKLIMTTLLGASLLAPAGAFARDETAAREESASTYVGTVDPTAFREAPRERDRPGATVSPQAVRMIVPGVDKFSIYRLIGPPHFNEGITRRWNYILFFPTAPGSAERVRCRMEIRFAPPGPGRYNVAVSEIVWQDRACADRVAQAS